MTSIKGEALTMLKKIFFLIAFFLLWGCTSGDARSETISVDLTVPEIAVRQDVTYAQYLAWPEARLKMDLLLPMKGDKKSPAVIFIPGGWWVVSPKAAGSQFTYRLAEEGYAVASIEYRLIAAANYREILGDVKAAVRYLRAHAEELNIDKDRIAVMGVSAGGYLAAMAGVTGGIREFDFGDNMEESSRVQAVIDIFGPTDLTRVAADYSREKQQSYASPGSPLSLLVNGAGGYKGNKGESLLDTPETATAACPLTYIGKDTPPFLIMHGTADTTISPSQSKHLWEALEQQGIYAEHYSIEGADHQFKYFFQPKAFSIILSFLHKVL